MRHLNEPLHFWTDESRGGLEEVQRWVLPSCLPEITSTCESENRKLKFTGMSVRKSSSRASCWLQTNTILAHAAAVPQHAANIRWAFVWVCDYTPFRQDSHSCGAQDVERRFLVLVLRDVLSSKAQQRADVVAGLVWCGCILWNTWTNRN